MNQKEKEMVTLLKNMRSQYGVVGVKAEFEAEGTRFEELLRLKDIAANSGLGIMLKIGGPEDVWGILQARRAGVSGIVAPMVESAYALRKFLEAVKKFIPQDEREDLRVAINIETAQAYQNLAAILFHGKELGLDCITIGRVDLVGSLGLSRNDVNSPNMAAIVKNICLQTQNLGFITTMGGGIERASQNLIKELVDLDLLNKFETRKIVFDAKQGLDSYENAINKAHQFELLWLENKRDHYKEIVNEDTGRISMLQKRVQ